MSKKLMVGIVATYAGMETGIGNQMEEWLKQQGLECDLVDGGLGFVDNAQFRQLARKAIKLPNDEVIGIIVKESNLPPGVLDDMKALAREFALELHVL